MKRICTLGVAVTVSFILIQSAEAGSRGGGRSFSSVPHFSGGAHYSAPAHHYAGPSRTYSSARFNGPARVSSIPTFHNRTYVAGGPRSSATALRNSAYFSDRARFSGNRTTAFNSQTYSRGASRLAPGRTAGTRSQGFNNNRERVVARHSGNWHRNWDRSRDHWWHGRRCHFGNNVWVIYEPFFGYPFGYGYGYGYYPYGAYYDDGSYDDSYSSNEYAPADDPKSNYSNEPSSNGDSRVTDVQSALSREGYYDGPIDGRLGDATRKALRRYQRDHGLEVTGGITSGVIKVLRLR